MAHYDWYKYTEKNMYGYYENIEALKQYEAALSYLVEHGDIRVQDYDGKFQSTEVVDRVLEYVHKKQTLERKIYFLRRNIYGVENVQKVLKARDDTHSRKLLAVMEYVYLDGSTYASEMTSIDEQEQKELKQELVHRVSHMMSKYEKVLGQS